MDAPILDEGLVLALEWGENFLKPVQSRIKALHPQLSDAEADECDTVCRAAMNFGLQEVVTCWKESNGQQFPASLLFTTRMRARYPWVSKETLSKLFTQGCYYGWKDGEIV